MQSFRECQTEEDKQELRDYMLEHMYHQVLTAHYKIGVLREMMEEMEKEWQQMLKERQ